MRSGIESGPVPTAVTAEVADGRHTLRAIAVPTGQGINIFLGGGEAPHVGTVAISQPRPSLTGDGTISCTTSVFNLVGHKDDILAVPLAEILCKELQQVIVVTAGVHIDNADEGDIARINGNMNTLAAKLMEALGTR